MRLGGPGSARSESRRAHPTEPSLDGAVLPSRVASAKHCVAISAVRRDGYIHLLGGKNVTVDFRESRRSPTVP